MPLKNKIEATESLHLMQVHMRTLNDFLINVLLEKVSFSREFCLDQIERIETQTEKLKGNIE